MTAVPPDHPKNFFAHHRFSETSACRFVSAWFFIIKQPQFVSLRKNLRLADGAMKIQHVQTKFLGDSNLPFSQFGRRKNSVYRPEAPAYRRAHNDTFPIEPKYCVRTDALRREPAEAKG